MKWFDGTVTEAIQKTRDLSAILLVFIEGNDDVSKNMNNTWDNDNVSHKIECNNFVCLKLSANTDECHQFSAFYPVITVPSTYFIGSNGKNRGVIAGFLEPDDFIAKIDETLKNINETKTENVNVLLEKRRKEKFEMEREQERKKEIERRTVGKGVTKLKQWQDTKESEEIRQQIKKDKEENKLAKEKIKEQIARDRAERKLAYEQEQKEKKQLEEKANQDILLKKAEEQRIEAAKKSEIARIQFRLPNGTTVNNFFPSNDKLSSALNYLKKEHSLSNIILLTNFPKRYYEGSDFDETFQNLQLAPSAVITVKHKGSSIGFNRVNPGNVGIISGMFNGISNIFSTFWLFVTSLIFGRSNQSTAISNNNSSRKQQPKPNSNSKKTDSETVRHRNVGRLSDMKDDDDDMTVYNGNSTQQM